MTLAEVEQQIRELRSTLELLTTQDIDMGLRRVKNLSPSRDQNDAVTRKELVQFLADAREAIINEITGGSGENVCVFGVGIQDDLEVGDDIGNRHIVSRAGTSQVKRVVGQVKIPPVGQSVKVAVFRNWGTDEVEELFTLDLETLGEVVELEDVSGIPALSALDTLTISVTQIGTEYSGKFLYLRIVYG